MITFVSIYLFYMFFEISIFFYNECFILGILCTFYCICFYVHVDLKFKENFYFDCIDDLDLEPYQIKTDDRKKWLNYFKNPNNKDFSDANLVM